MKRVLIVTSTYRPAMAPDMQRARMLAHDLPSLGWDVEVLTPDVAHQRPEQVDPDSAEFFAPAPTHEVPPWLPGVFRTLSVGSIAWRSLVPMYRRGKELLASGRFDLVYISTANFPLFCLGPLWRRFGVPYVLDFQDPWYVPKSPYLTTNRRIKFAVNRMLAKPLERWALRHAAALVSVSPRYLTELSTRYEHDRPLWLASERQRTIPFAASQRDLQTARSAATPDRSPTRTLDVVHVGLGGRVRAKSMEALAAGLAEFQRRRPAESARVRIRLYGTTGGLAFGANMMREIAESHGVGELVDEQPAQVSYRRSLELAAAADGLLVLGVDDAGYTPSKLFNYLLFSKPVLACLYDPSPACAFLEEHPDCARRIRFGPGRASTSTEAADAIEQFVADMAVGRTIDNLPLVEDQLAPVMARRHADLFDLCEASNP